MYTVDHLQDSGDAQTMECYITTLLITSHSMYRMILNVCMWIPVLGTFLLTCPTDTSASQTGILLHAFAMSVLGLCNKPV